MKERNGTRSPKSALSRMRARFSALCLLLLCFVSSAMGLNSLLERNLLVRPARHRQNGNKQLNPSVTNLPLWQGINRENLARSHAVTGIVPKLYRALSLNETA